MKDCYACNTPTKTYGRYRQPKIMEIHVAGKQIFLCPSCRALWADMRYGFIKKYGRDVRDKSYQRKLWKVFEIFCLTRREKVEFT